ncbi:MAG: S-layer homology domain-containing protein [Oscillibacter sp.]|jgi:hypothetical protein|nr:S-layer homology domain-containing protein [Oscillibacter sp.]
MKKARFAALFLALALLLGSVPAYALGKNSLLPQKRAYSAPFADTAGTWCDSYVQTCYEAALLDGKSAGKFDPSAALTYAQITVISARLLSFLTGGILAQPASGEAWYAPSGQSLLSAFSKAGITEYPPFLGGGYLTELADSACERADFVFILSCVLQCAKVTLPAVNQITVLPDSADDGVLAFYNAGILTGSDAYGTFRGSDDLTRGQAAAMLARLADPSQRVKFTPKTLSYAKELLGLNNGDLVMTIDGFSVTAEMYAAALMGQIITAELERSFAIYEKYQDYYEAYWALEDSSAYSSFADYLQKVHGVDADAESTVSWNTPDKAGLTPAQKAEQSVLTDLRRTAVLFNHAADYPLTAQQTAEAALEISERRPAYFGFSDNLIAAALQAQALSANMALKYAPAAGDMAGILDEAGYFYGRCLGVGYDLSASEEDACFERTEAQAKALAQTARQSAAEHLSDPDYFSYLCWKYGDSSSDTSDLISTDELSAADRAVLKGLRVGELSPVLDQPALDENTGLCCVFLRDDPSGDQDVITTLGAQAAEAQLAVWAETIAAAPGAKHFDVAAAAAKLEQLSGSLSALQ